jgi:hypothetical protein
VKILNGGWYIGIADPLVHYIGSEQAAAIAVADHYPR